MSIFSHVGAGRRDYSDIPSFQVRPQAAGIRRSVQAHPEEEGQDHQEVGPQAGVQRVQVEEPGEHSEERLSNDVTIFRHLNSLWKIKI